MRRAEIVLEGPGADVVAGALRPEAGRDVPKARVAVAGRRGRVSIRIDAEDTGALRAAVNSYLRWSDVAMRVREQVSR
ncbi:MAG: hypothetical protein A3K66_05540 [Euryarchaeota archaeon RBG_16_67_27]|nr:MAG: hypothetical protein A3K66_05540 [Euryarchaeota archaeon RBG_16_67_27]